MANVDFYFAYEIVSQMAALYGVAFRAQEEGATGALQSVVADMGVTFKLAEESANATKRAPASAASSWIDLTERLRRLQPRLTPWTGGRRWLWILRACETSWQHALEDMMRVAGEYTPELKELTAASRERVGFLAGRDSHVRDLHRRRNDSYAVPVPL